MATRYNVYASGIESDADSHGEWVQYEEHQQEIESLQEDIADKDNEIEELRRLLQEVSDRKEHLERALREIIES